MTGIALSSAMLALFIFHFATVRSIVSIWNSSETFAHGYIILPISMWLIWKRRDILKEIPSIPYWPTLIFLAACGFAWLLAELGGVQVVKQYAFVAMIPFIVLAILGVRVSWAIAFPLLFLLLAVPFGDIFIEPLIGFTADFTVAALQATGIPVLRNGNNFEIPSGTWSVVEACSGVRYLIASFTLGCLFAYLNYRSRARQLMFIVLSVVVPIIANGMRAYMIVIIGHLSGMELATGVDHLIYGWVFFGLVMFLMFWIGSFWREDTLEHPVKRPADTPTVIGRHRSVKPVVGATVATILCIGMWPAYALFIDRALTNTSSVQLSGFGSQWQESTPFTEWEPQFFPANSELYRFFQHENRKVGLKVMLYQNQGSGAQLISSSNKLVVEKDPQWQRLATSTRQEMFGSSNLTVREAVIRGAPSSLVIWQWYWIDGKFTSNDYVGKLLQAKKKILMRGGDDAALLVFAPYSDTPNEAREVLRSFLSQNLPSLEAALASSRKP